MDPFQDLITNLSRLPGVGRKSASRIAYHLMLSRDGQARRLAESIMRAQESCRVCSVCGYLSDADPCAVCSDARRERGLITVVAESRDVLAIERTREYRGLYHVLGGVIAPLKGVGPDELNIAGLVGRLSPGSGVEEVVLALNFSVEGETTAMYLARIISPLGVRTTRIARGLPAGAELEYADDATLAGAMESRKPVQ